MVRFPSSTFTPEGSSISSIGEVRSSRPGEIVYQVADASLTDDRVLRLLLRLRSTPQILTRPAELLQAAQERRVNRGLPGKPKLESVVRKSKSSVARGGGPGRW